LLLVLLTTSAPAVGGGLLAVLAAALARPQFVFFLLLPTNFTRLAPRQIGCRLSKGFPTRRGGCTSENARSGDKNSNTNTRKERKLDLNNQLQLGDSYAVSNHALCQTS
jgi:hypothetical protein